MLVRVRLGTKPIYDGKSFENVENQKICKHVISKMSGNIFPHPGHRDYVFGTNFD